LLSGVSTTVQLKREGYTFNHKRVLRLMHEKELLVKPRKGYVRTTDSAHGIRVYPCLYSRRTFRRVDEGNATKRELLHTSRS